MPQFNQINNNASFDQSLMSQSYIDGLGAVAERRSKERERQAKMINAVKLAMDRLGVVGNKAFVNEDGVIDARFNTFDGRKKYGEDTDFSYTGDHNGRGPGTFSESALVNPGGDEALDRVSKMNAQQPIGSGNGILPIYNTTTGTIQPAGSLVKIGIQNLQQQQQQQPQQPQQPQKPPPSTADQVKALLDTYMQTTKSDGNNTNVSWNQSNRLGFQQKYGVNKETTKNSKVTDASADMGFAALESSAILEQAILGTAGPIAEALKNKQNTVMRRDAAITTDGVTNDLTAGEFNVSSDVSIGGSVGVGQTTTISNSTNIKQGGPPTTTGTKRSILIESGLDALGKNPHTMSREAFFDSNGKIQNIENFQNVVSTGTYGVNLAKITRDPDKEAEVMRSFEGNFSNIIKMYKPGDEIYVGNNKIILSSTDNFHKELKAALKSAASKIVTGKEGEAQVVRLPDGTILSLGRQNNGVPNNKQDAIGIMAPKIGTKWHDEAQFQTFIQTFLGGQ